LKKKIILITPLTLEKGAAASHLESLDRHQLKADVVGIGASNESQGAPRFAPLDFSTKKKTANISLAAQRNNDYYKIS
jgi:hypothetical protein